MGGRAASPRAASARRPSAPARSTAGGRSETPKHALGHDRQQHDAAGEHRPGRATAAPAPSPRRGRPRRPWRSASRSRTAARRTATAPIAAGRACPRRAPRTRRDACRGSRRWSPERRRARAGCRRGESLIEAWSGSRRVGALPHVCYSAAQRAGLNPLLQVHRVYEPDAVTAASDDHCRILRTRINADHMDRPLLLIDVDGVISLFGFDPADPPAGRFQLVDGIAHFLSATARRTPARALGRVRARLVHGLGGEGQRATSRSRSGFPGLCRSSPSTTSTGPPAPLEARRDRRLRRLRPAAGVGRRRPRRALRRLGAEARPPRPCWSRPSPRSGSPRARASYAAPPGPRDACRARKAEPSNDPCRPAPARNRSSPACTSAASACRARARWRSPPPRPAPPARAATAGPRACTSAGSARARAPAPRRPRGSRRPARPG